MTLADPLEGQDVKATTIEVGAVPVGTAEEELHQSKCLEHDGEAFW